jgi:hypothetical protein
MVWYVSRDIMRDIWMTVRRLFAKYNTRTTRAILRFALVVVGFVAFLAVTLKDTLEAIETYNTGTKNELSAINPFFLLSTFTDQMDNCAYNLGNTFLTGHTVCRTKEERDKEAREAAARVKFCNDLQADRNADALDGMTPQVVTPLTRPGDATFPSWEAYRRFECSLSQSANFAAPTENCYGHIQGSGYLPNNLIVYVSFKLDNTDITHQPKVADESKRNIEGNVTSVYFIRLLCASEQIIGGLIFRPLVCAHNALEEALRQPNIAKMVIFLPFCVVLFVALGAGVVNPYVLALIVLICGGILARFEIDVNSSNCNVRSGSRIPSRDRRPYWSCGGRFPGKNIRFLSHLQGSPRGKSKI